ncbi:hypothetical protein JCM8547_007377 [Rhodosporidiobolus lusitaniae]
MSDGAASKGKARAHDDDALDSLERQPLLSPSLDSSPAPPSSPSSSPASKRHSRLRHGRGPLVPDSDDEQGEDGRPNNVSEDTTPLRYVVVAPPSSSDRHARWTWGSVLCLVFGVLVVSLLVVTAAVHLWVGHLLKEQARYGTVEEMAQRGFLFEGPSAVRVQALPDDDGQGGGGGGLMVEIDGMAGVDVRKALDWESKDGSRGWFRRTEGRIARWGIRKAKSVAVDVGEIAIYDASSLLEEEQDPLLVIPSLDTIHLPLSYPSLSDPLPTLSSFTLHVPVTFPSPEDLVRFGKAAWESKEYKVRADVRCVGVKVGAKETKGVAGWFTRRMGEIKVGGLRRLQEGVVPALPAPSDPMSMLTNLTYTVAETPSPSPSHPNSTVLSFSAGGDLHNPLLPAVKEGRTPPFAWGLPFRLPVTVSLPLPPLPNATSGKDGKGKKGGRKNETEPATVLLAKVETLPFSFPLSAETAPFQLQGHVVPAGNLSTPPTAPSLPPSSRHREEGDEPTQPPLSRALSHFVARFLSGRPNTITLAYDSFPELPTPGSPSRDDAPYPPSFLSQILANEVFTVSVPGTNATPDFFRNLRMEDMRVKLGGSESAPDADLLASGRVVGEVVLPEEVRGLEGGLEAKWIWPDVLVYDGELPARTFASSPEEDDQVDFFGSSSSQLSFSSSSSDSDPYPDAPPAYPPSPLPPTAFARMSPSSSMPSLTQHIPANSTHPARTLISSQFVDAPLYLLPGRGDVLRRFVAKIIFGPPGNRVKASMRGLAGVDVEVGGFGEIALSDVPIEASFFVGRGGVENPPV